jgi:hypothetical protein
MKPSTDERVDPTPKDVLVDVETWACPGVGIMAHTTTALIAVNALYFIATSPFGRRQFRYS